MAEMIPVIYEDNHLLIVDKPCGILSQGDYSGDESILEICRNYIKEKYQKPGNVFLGLVHRLDRPVSGVMLFARTSKAAARLQEQFASRTIHKYYITLTHKKPSIARSKTWVRYEAALYRDKSITRIREGQEKNSALWYALADEINGYALGCIKLETGRKHQIRGVLAHLGSPVIGDTHYGSKSGPDRNAIALHAHSIEFEHPTTKKVMSITVPIPVRFTEIAGESDYLSSISAVIESFPHNKP
jgi:23S rRNA pseudouridine1911/1915/1917 synthase